MQELTSYNDALPTAQEYALGDENLPEASTTDPSRILDSDEYEVYKNVPVFVEHTRTLKSGRELRFGRDELEKLAERSNRRIQETGDFAPVVIGHTNPDPAAPDPPKIGWAGPFRLGWLTKDHTKYAVLADFRIEKDKTSVLNKYPRRSAELWAEDRYEDMYLDPISLLGADTPWSDMGVLYCKQGDAALEKIYYSITPQVPGPYGTGFPQPVTIKNDSEKKREKETYAMEDNEYGQDQKKLSDDQRNTVDVIVNAIFDSPEFKFLRKLMNENADENAADDEKTLEKDDENDANDGENEDFEENSENFEENEISNDNKTPEKAVIAGDEDENDDEEEDDDEEDDSYSDDEEDSDSDSDSDDDFDAYLDKNGMSGYKKWFKKQREQSQNADSEENDEDEEEGGHADYGKAESDEPEDDDDEDVDSMSDEEFEEYLKKKYGVADADMDDVADEDEDDEEEEAEHANYAKADDLEGGNPYLTMTVEELDEYLRAKYGEEPPTEGEAYEKLTTDLAYFALLLKLQDRDGLGGPEDDDDFDRIDARWENQAESDAAGAEGIENIKLREASLRQHFAQMSPEDRKNSDEYYRWKYSRYTTPHAMFYKGDAMTPKEYYSRKGRGDDDVVAPAQSDAKQKNDDSFDSRRLLQLNSDEELAKHDYDAAVKSGDQKAIDYAKGKLDSIKSELNEVRLQKHERDVKQAEKYAKNEAGIAVSIFDPEYDDDLIWTSDATIGEMNQLNEWIDGSNWRDPRRQKLGRDLSKAEETAAWLEHLAQLARKGVWWATNPKLNEAPDVAVPQEGYDDGVDYCGESDKSAVPYEGEEDGSVDYDKEQDEITRQLDAILAGDDGEEEVPPDDSLVDDDEEDDEISDEEALDLLDDPDDDLESDGEYEESEGYDQGEDMNNPDYISLEDVHNGKDKSVQYHEGEEDCEDGDCRTREELIDEMKGLKSRIKELEKAFDWTTEKVVSAERYSRLHDLRSRYLFDEEEERERCRYFKMSDEQFEKRICEIQTNYRRVPTGIEVPPGLVGAAPSDAERPGAVQYSKEAAADFERRVADLAADYAARGIYKPSDEIRAEVAGKQQNPDG